MTALIDNASCYRSPGGMDYDGRTQSSVVSAWRKGNRWKVAAWPTAAKLAGSSPAALTLSAGDRRKAASSTRWIRVKLGRGNHPLLRTEDARALTCRDRMTAKRPVFESQLARRLLLMKQARSKRYYERNRARVLARVRSYRERNRDALNQRRRELMASNPELAKRYYLTAYKNNRAKICECVKRWIRKHRTKHNQYTKKTNHHYRDELHDVYVRSKLSRGTTVPASAWPDSLVKLKRAELKVKRALWQLQKTSQNSASNS